MKTSGNDRADKPTQQLGTLKNLFQFIRFLLVGCMNTLVTLAVIFVCKSLLGVDPYVSNAIGYIAGIINAFLWSRSWVYRSKGNIGKEAVTFLAGFVVCYLLQLLCVWTMLHYSQLGNAEWPIFGFTLSGYGVATIIGMGFYTISNYVFNRVVTFRKNS